MNRKTISLSRDGQYAAHMRLEVRLDCQHITLVIPEGKMEVKPLVKPPWTLNDSEQRELDSQEECPQTSDSKININIRGEKIICFSGENCSQQYQVTTCVSSVRRKSDKNCNWRQQNEGKIRFCPNCPWRHLLGLTFQRRHLIAFPDTSSEKLNNKHYLFVCPRMFCVISRLRRDKQGAGVMRREET